jgi:hypothetical protein
MKSTILVDQSGLEGNRILPGPASDVPRDSVVADARFVDLMLETIGSQAIPSARASASAVPNGRVRCRRPRLKAIARTPESPAIAGPTTANDNHAPMTISSMAIGARVRNIAGLADRSVYGLPG